MSTSIPPLAVLVKYQLELKNIRDDLMEKHQQIVNKMERKYQDKMSELLSQKVKCRNQLNSHFMQQLNGINHELIRIQSQLLYLQYTQNNHSIINKNNIGSNTNNIGIIQNYQETQENNHCDESILNINNNTVQSLPKQHEKEQIEHIQHPQPLKINVNGNDEDDDIKISEQQQQIPSDTSNEEIIDSNPLDIDMSDVQYDDDHILLTVLPITNNENMDNIKNKNQRSQGLLSNQNQGIQQMINNDKMASIDANITNISNITSSITSNRESIHKKTLDAMRRMDLKGNMRKNRNQRKTTKNIRNLSVRINNDRNKDKIKRRKKKKKRKVIKPLIMINNKNNNNRNILNGNVTERIGEKRKYNDIYRMNKRRRISGNKHGLEKINKRIYRSSSLSSLHSLFIQQNEQNINRNKAAPKKPKFSINRNRRNSLALM